MFEPWVGPHFDNGGSSLATRKLLVLGESHHSDEHEVGAIVPEMTLDTFRQYRAGPWVRWMRTFDNIAAAVSGKSKRQLGTAGVHAVWDDIAFYNYVPVVAASYARERPSAAHFTAGAEPFRHVLRKLQPGFIIVCGYELWGRMIPSHAVDYVDDPWRPTSLFARIEDANIPALRMIHPSTAFSPHVWTPRIEELFRL